MTDLLAKRLKQGRKSLKLSQLTNGFTLIELLVAMILATLVITPLLGFMLNIMNSDRQEQAKATSATEIQAALDYIAQDLAQAIYIYDADALTRDLTSLPNTSGIRNQIPPIADTPGCTSPTTCIPVLVFWKRETRKNVIPVVGIPAKDDSFVYSLVAYYLIKGDTSSGTWSNTARISRFQINDGVIDPNDPTNNNVTPPTTKFITGYEPSQGYQNFDLSKPGSTLKDKMNLWEKDRRQPYTTPVATLIDFVDQNTTNLSPNCPTNTQQVPSTSNLIGGFYACIDSARTLAQVTIRGNALARIQNNSTYSASNSTYFPTASIQVKGRGLLGVN